MKVLEIIHLQSGAGSITSLSDQVRESLQRADERSRIVAIYRRDGLVNDLAIHIQYTSRSKAAKQTELGLRLAAALREYGIVEHTRWTEI
jgi:adenosylmethionine-8-amino-7-oxononanoate aminotransferase